MFWDELTEDDRAALLASGTRRLFGPDSTLFLQGEEPTYVTVVLSGYLKLARSTPEGRKILIELRGPGCLVGELGMMDAQPRSASASAVGSVDVLTIGTAKFLALLSERSNISLAVIHSLSIRLRQSAERRLEAGTGSAFVRLCSRLIELADGHEPDPNGVVSLDLPLTQQELAEWIGVTRDALVLVLRRLRKLGWISTGRQRVEILDLAALRDAAEQ